MVLTSFPLQKELPTFSCLSSNQTLNITQYNTSKNFKVFDSPRCILKHCPPTNSTTFSAIRADYSSITNFITVLDKFCDMDLYTELYTRVVYGCRLIGNLIIPFISDKYGRKKAFLMMLTMVTISNIGFLTIHNDYAYILFSGMTYFTMSGISISIIIAVENMRKELYSIMGVIQGINLSINGLLAYITIHLMKSWYLHVILYVINNIALFIFNMRILTETPDYLLEKKDYESLETALKRMAEYNGIKSEVEKMLSDISEADAMNYKQDYKSSSKLSDIDKEKKRERKNSINSVNSIISINSQNINDITSNNDSNNKAKGCMNTIYDIAETYRNLYKQKTDRYNFLKMILPMGAFNFLYFTQLMFIERIPGDIATNSFLIFAQELISPSVGMYLTQKFNRKNVIVISYFITFILCMIFPLLVSMETSTSGNIAFYINSFMVLSINFISCMAVANIFILLSEIFSVNVRSTATGLIQIIISLSVIMSADILNLFSSPFYIYAFLFGFGTYSLYLLDIKA